MAEDVAMLPATELVGRYRRGTLSPVEATRAALERIRTLNPELNAFCVVDEQAALAAARASEDRWQRGAPLGLVDGVPTTIKDTYLAKGWPTRRGSRTVPEMGPWEEDAPATARLREQGAVLLGKTTTPEFGWKAVTDSPLTGVTRNPWNPQRTPGGSSGGACAAAAIGMGALHLGGDGGGSIRIPAAFCGVYGFKATFGRVPLYPQPVPGTITHAGPITRTVEDAALMLTVISGPDARDWQALAYEPRDYRIGLDAGVRGLRIAYTADFGYADVDAEVARIVGDAVGFFRELGATVEQTHPGFENPRGAFDTYYYSRFAFVLQGTDKAQRSLMDPGLLEIAEEGRRYGLVDLLRAEVDRGVLSECLSLFHERYDLLITPQVAVAPFEAGEEVPVGSGMKRWLDWSPFTYPFNFTGQPAASVPCGLTRDGLPVAMQIVGRRFDEPLVLRASRAFEAARPFPRLAQGHQPESNRA
jgi:aspartyl-tRNA(Asn)/glutamyl-tRNA(Gln) amidotransferase subunit A